ncbi:hypothetical protein [Amaricoccus macauensis]|uniref:hypothetical protein n=1 Tax=Amaricoccus macauensis TaxID=57001 RepID=UPI003C7DF4C1
MEIWANELTNLVVSTAISLLVPYLVYALERYLKIRLDTAAREVLDSAMRNGADWLIREGRAPTAREVMEYVKQAAPDAVARWQLDGMNRELAEARAQAVIERAKNRTGGPGNQEPEGQVSQ